MTIWEYQIDIGSNLGGSLKTDELQDHLDKRGRESWELVVILPRLHTKGVETMLIFKRPMPGLHGS